MDRELTYQMPFERLVRLSRSAGRKAYALHQIKGRAACGAAMCMHLASVLAQTARN